MKWRAQLRRAAMLLGGIAVPFGWLLALPASGAQPAAAVPHTVTVGDSAEAWYAAAPVDVCTTPLGCPPQDAPTSPYPEDTLHVGVAGGQETARTYLLPDLSTIPFGTSFGATTMTVPVATGSNDGTASPDTAHVVACLVTQPFPDGADGSTQARPKADCSVADKATYDAKHNVFTVHLDAVAGAWSAGALTLGVALMPDPKATQPTDAWHVAINGRKRQGTPHVSTTVTYFGSDAVSSGGVTVGSDDGSGVPGNVSAPPPQMSTSDLPPPTSAQPPAAPPVVAGQPTAPVAQQPVAFATGVPQPLAFVVPLLLLAGAVFFARVFTRDATPLAARS